MGKVTGKVGRKNSKVGGQQKENTDSVCRGGFSKVCGKVLKETDCVSCDICHEWFHPACQKLSTSAFSALCQYEFFWSCDMCKVKLPDIIEAGKSHISVNNKIDEVVESIEKHQKMVKEQLDEVAALMSSQKDMHTSTTAKIGDLEKSMEEMSTAISGGTSDKKKLETSLRKVVKDEVKAMRDQVTETVSALEKEKNKTRAGGPELTQTASQVTRSVKECMEQEKRRRNLVIHNLKEPDSELSLEEKCAQDKDEFQDMCKKTMRLNTRVERSYRIGRVTGDRPRLMIVVLEEEATKWEVLKMAKSLRDMEKYSNIYVTPDLTPEEQARDKALRAELKRRKSAGESVEIRRGRIVIKKVQERKEAETEPSSQRGSEVHSEQQVETIPKRVE